jgi:hypothetical protein
MDGDGYPPRHGFQTHTIEWPEGTRWDAAWHAVDYLIGPDALPAMERLEGRYKHRVAWQMTCHRAESLAMRDRGETPDEMVMQVVRVGETDSSKALRWRPVRRLGAA